MRVYWATLVIYAMWCVLLVGGCSSAPAGTTLSQASEMSDRYYHPSITATSTGPGVFDISSDAVGQYEIKVTANGTTTTYSGNGSNMVTGVNVAGADSVEFCWAESNKKIRL